MKPIDKKLINMRWLDREKFIDGLALRPIFLQGSCPTMIPSLYKRESAIIAGINQGIGEILILCESIEEMQYLYNELYLRGRVFSLRWYGCECIYGEDNIWLLDSDEYRN